MGNDIQNTKASAEDLAIERAEQRLSDPSAANMQFLQSTLDTHQFDSVGAASSYFNASGRSFSSPSAYSGGSVPGLSPAYSGAGLLAAVSAADMGGMGSAMAMAAQVASAAPVTFGKNTVGDSAVLANLGDKAHVSNELVNLQDSLPIINSVLDPNSIALAGTSELDQLLTLLTGNVDGVDPNEALMSLIGGIDQNPNPENLQTAIAAIEEQIGLLNTTFAPVFDNLGEEVQNQVALQNSLPATDLGLSILDDAGSVSSTLSDLIGSIDVANNPQLGSLLNLDSTFDNISSLVGSFPDLDLTPITNPITDIVGGITAPIIDIVGGITDPIIDPITDIVGGITDPIIDPITDIVGGITDPIIDPITDIVGGITDPIIDPVTDIVVGIVDPVIDPILGPVTDIVGGITDPIIDPVTDIVDGLLPDLGLLSGLSSGSSGPADGGLLDSLGSGISSSAGSDGGALDGLLGSLDPHK